MRAAILNADEIAAKFSESLRAIAKLQGFSEKVVTMAETGVVLKTCVYRTKIAKPDEVSQRARSRVLKNIGLTSGKLTVSINSGAKGPLGRVWAAVGVDKKTGRSKGGTWLLAGQMSDDAQKFTPTKYHLLPRLWFDVRDLTNQFGVEYRRADPIAQKSAGLARQSWVQMADDIGLILEDIPGGPASSQQIAKARRAIASNGRTYQNGIGTEAYEENKSYFVTLTNRLPYWPKIGLDTMLLSVLAGRAQYFRQNVDKAVFASFEATVRAYPWLKIVGAGV